MQHRFVGLTHKLFEIFIEGKDGHAAMPQNTLNPILVANNLLQSFQTAGT